MMVDPTAEAPKHGHWLEYMISVVDILACCLFVMGSYCFESSSDAVYAFGDWGYIVACLANIAVSGHDLCEKFHHANLMKPKDRDEISEAAFFLVSALAFTAGCVFFLPSVSDKLGTTASAAGAWLCITGSFGLVFAVFFNALCFEAQAWKSKLAPGTAKWVRQLTKINICCLLFGSMFFCVGSFMYRPVFGGTCQRGTTDAVCEAVSAYGTKCYLYGSYAFLIGAFTGLINCHLKATGEIGSDETKPLREGMLKHQEYSGA